MFSYAINVKQLLINLTPNDKLYLCKCWLDQINAFLYVYNGTLYKVKNLAIFVNVLRFYFS
jgi:hypothetical protein